MADPNSELEESAELLRKLNEELRSLGYVTDQTARALGTGGMKRAKELEAAGEKAVDALSDLAGSVLNAAKAMNQGAKGASAFNGAIDQAATGIIGMVTVLGLLVPLGRALKPLGNFLKILGVNVAKVNAGTVAMTAGIAAAAITAKKFTDLMQAANEQADKLYKGYSDLAKSGAAASDGMKGVFEDAKKLGIAVNEIDGLVSVVAQNATELTLFGGGVVKGRQQLAAMGKTLEGSREYFLRLGYDMTAVTETMADYIKQQRVAGDFTVRTAADIDRLGQGARRYLEEQDALTKLTGMARQEQEKAREQVRSQERFAAQLETLRQQRRFKEAKALEDTYLILQSQNREAAQGFADIQTGNVQTEAAQKSLMGTQGESMRVAQQIVAGQMGAAEGAQRIARAHGQTARSLGTTMGMIGTYNDTFGDLAGDLRLAGLAEQDIVKILEKIEQDRKKLSDKEGKGADKMLVDQAKLRATQIRANEAIERFVSDKGLPAATKAAQLFAEGLANGTEKINELFGEPAERKVFPSGTATKSPTESARPVTGGYGADYFKQAPGESAASFKKRMEDYARSQGATVPPAPGTAPGGAPAAAPRPGAGTGMLKGAAAKNLNPGNLEFKGQAGATLSEDGRFAKFATVDQGVVALANQLDLYLTGKSQSGKLDTVRSLIGVYAPPDENKTEAYVDNVAKFMGVDPDAKLSRDAKTMAQLATAIIGQENQGRPSAGYDLRDSVTAAVAQVLGIKPGEVPKFADGGIATGPTDGYTAELHGTEAVVPLPDGKTIPVRLENDPQTDALNKALRTFAELTSISKLMEVRSTDATTVISPDLAANQAMASIMNKIWPEIQKGFDSGKLTIDQFHRMFGPVDPEEQARLAAEATQKYTYDSFAKGGITSGPSIAGEAGPEAVVPLPDGKAIPVTINLKDAASMGTGAYGENEYTGVNLGPISTDLEALKQIAGQLGAYDAATETITDPAVWKEILSTGMLMNFDVAGAKIGTKMFGPDIGLEIGAAVKEVMATGDTDVATALQEVKDQFKEAMTMVVDAMKDKDYETQQQMLETLQNIARSQSQTADASQRLAQVAAN